MVKFCQIRVPDFLFPRESGAEFVVSTAQVFHVQAGAHVERHGGTQFVDFSDVEHTIVVELVPHTVLAARAGGGDAQFSVIAGVDLNTDTAKVLVGWSFDENGGGTYAWVHHVCSFPRDLSVSHGSVHTKSDWAHSSGTDVEASGNTNGSDAVELGVNSRVEGDFWGGGKVGFKVDVGFLVGVVEVEVTEVESRGGVEGAVVFSSETWNLFDVEGEFF